VLHQKESKYRSTCKTMRIALLSGTFHNYQGMMACRRALGQCKPSPTRRQLPPLCSPGGGTIFGGGSPCLVMVKNSSILSWIQMLIRITTKI